jgi:flagellar basal-body rod protein FlgB
MEIGDIPMLSMLKERMTWLSQRQDLLSQNVANVDVPGYAARDLKKPDFAEALRNASTTDSVTLATTNPNHIPLSQSDGGFEEMKSPDQEAGPQQNTVSLETEMMKVADTQAQFQAATNLYAKALDMMKIAIGKPGS